MTDQDRKTGTEGLSTKTEIAALNIIKGSQEDLLRRHLLKTVPKDILKEPHLREFGVSLFLNPRKRHEVILSKSGCFDLVLSYPFKPNKKIKLSEIPKFPTPEIYYTPEIEESEEMKQSREAAENAILPLIFEFIKQCDGAAKNRVKEYEKKAEQYREKAELHKRKIIDIEKRLRNLAREIKGSFPLNAFKVIIDPLDIKDPNIDNWTEEEVSKFLKWFSHLELLHKKEKALQKEVTRFVPYSKALEKNRHYQQYDWKDDQLDLFEQEDLFKKFEEIEKRLIEKENKNLILGLKDLTEPENKALTAVQSIFYNKGYTLDEGGELEIEETEFFKAYGLEKQGKEGRKEYTGYDKATARKALLSLSTTQRVYIDKDGNKTEFSAGSLCWITFGKELLKEQQKGENKESRPRYENGKLIRRYFKISIHPLVKKGIISDSGKMLITEKGAGASVVYKPEGFNSMFTELLKTRPELFKKGLQRPARLFKGTMDAIGTTDKAFTTPRNFLNYLYLQYTERQGKVKRDHIKWKVLASKIGLAEKTINRTPKQALKILERCFILAENLNLIKPDWELKYGFLDFTILTSAEHYYKPKKDPQPY